MYVVITASPLVLVPDVSVVLRMELVGVRILMERLFMVGPTALKFLRGLRT